MIKGNMKHKHLLRERERQWCELP